MENVYITTTLSKINGKVEYAWRITYFVWYEASAVLWVSKTAWNH